MFLSNRGLMYAIVLLFGVSWVACTGVQSFDNPSWTEVQIADMNDVVGNWEGQTWMTPRSVQEQNWAKVKIENDGTYEFAMYRNIGAWAGKGTVELQEGKLVAPPSDEGGTLKMTLYKSGDRRMLRVDATNKKGRLQRAELNPVKKKNDGY